MPLGRVAALLERVEDEVEAVLERGREVVADVGDVPGDDFGEVGETPPPARRTGAPAGRPVMLFLDELQRVYEFEDHGLRFLADLIDLYTVHREVVLLVDGSEERLLDELFERAQLGKLLNRHDVAPRILQGEWRAALPGRFAQVGLEIGDAVLEKLITFGAERPYETMWVCQRAALSAVHLGTGELTDFDADLAITAAVEEL